MDRVIQPLENGSCLVAKLAAPSGVIRSESATHAPVRDAYPSECVADPPEADGADCHQRWAELAAFPESRLYNLTKQNPEKVGQFGAKAEFLNAVGYAVVLRDEVGNLVDVAGNLDGDNNTNDIPAWKLPNCITSKGFRTSIIRQYEDGLPLEGTKKSSWFRGTEMRRTVVTYYGHPRDRGNPGWKKGGPLPVQLSSFKAERTEQGAVLKWTTESELENAGFNVLRSEKKTGVFKPVNPRILQGAGTTSERSSYAYVDTTAKEGVAYYYRLEEVSFEGVRQPVATRRLRGHVSAGNRYLTTFGDMKKGE